MEDRSCRQEADNGYPPRMAAEYLIGMYLCASQSIMLLPYP